MGAVVENMGMKESTLDVRSKVKVNIGHKNPFQ